MNQSNSQVHPVLKGILNTVLFKGLDVDMPEIEAYKKALRCFDWQYQHGSHQAFTDGSREIKKLYAVQKAIDPHGSIWREIMPKGHGIPLPSVQGAKRYTVTAYVGAEPVFKHTDTYASSIDAQLAGMEKFGHDGLKIVVKSE